jgi:uncharacterized protein YndB with AHSA1/START domain
MQLLVAMLPSIPRNPRLHIERKEPSVPNSVEREILIEASPEIIWSVITEPDQISRWFSDEADVQGRAGADGTLTWRQGGRGGYKESDLIVPIRVVEAEPFRRFAFRWSWERHLGEMRDYVASERHEATG